MSRIIQLIETIATIGFLTSLVCNAFLIFLTHFMIKRKFGSYKWLITSFAVSGIAFSAVQRIVTPVSHNFNSGNCFFTTKRPFNAQVWVMQILLVVFCDFIFGIFSMLTIQFIYRYLAVFNSNKLVYFDGWKITFWVFCPPILGSFWTVAVLQFTYPTNFSNSYEEIYNFYGENITSVASLAMILYDNTMPYHPHIHWNHFCFLLISVSFLLLYYIVIIYCGYQMHQEIKSKTVNFSPTSRRLHRQFFEALVLQIIAPSAILFIPMLFVLVIPLLQYKISFPTGVLFSWIGIYPASDALVLMYIVREYSRAVKSIARALLGFIIQDKGDVHGTIFRTLN